MHGEFQIPLPSLRGLGGTPSDYKKVLEESIAGVQNENYHPQWDLHVWGGILRNQRREDICLVRGLTEAEGKAPLVEIPAQNSKARHDRGCPRQSSKT